MEKMSSYFCFFLWSINCVLCVVSYLDHSQFKATCPIYLRINTTAVWEEEKDV